MVLTSALRRRVLRSRLVLLTMLAALLLPIDTGQAAGLRVDLKVERYTLPNGLEVVLQRDTHLPTVSTNLMYHVGAADEVAGRTGFAHLFEHVMFEGSGHVKEGLIDTLIEPFGAHNNAYTSFDVTDYQFTDLPSDQLELALWLDADRMGFLLDRLDRTSLATQQAVVRNERREGEQSPYGLTDDEVYHQLFPKEHPYHGAVMGSHTDIQAAKLADFKDFFKRYYIPNNATLAVVGNLDMARTKAWIKKYFGTIPRGAEPPKPAITIPHITAEKRVVMTDEVELPRVTMGWLTSPAFTPGDAEAKVAAQLLAGGESSRLYTSLVRDRKIAQDVSAYQDSQKYPSVFTIQATAKPGHTAKELEKAIDAELAAQAKAGPDIRELSAARAGLVSDLVRGLETLGDYGGRGDRLNTYNHYLGTPDYVNKDIARYEGVAGADVKRFVREQLRPSGRVVIHTNPGKRILPPDPPAPPIPPAGAEPPPSAEPWRNKIPGAGPAPTVPVPTIQRFSLDNGLPVYLVESHYLPVVTASVVSRYGSAADPRGREGLASFTAKMLTQGTEKRDADAIAREVAGFGGLLDSSAAADGSSVTVQALSPEAGRALALTADLVRRSTFPKKDIRRVRDDLLVGLRQQASDPGATAWNLFRPAVYGRDHPYGHPAGGTRRGVTNVTRADLTAFQAKAFTPGSAALVLAGDLTTKQARALATDAFGTWRGTGPRLPAPGPGSPAAERVVIVDMPGTSQTALEIGQAGLPRSDPDFEGLAVANRLLGGLFSSRLNNNLRETHGYTYGANSDLSSGRGYAPFDAYASVETSHTGDSVKEILKELRRLREEKMTGEEFRRGRDSYIRSVPALFQTTPGSVDTAKSLYLYDLPPDYFKGLAGRLARYNPARLRDLVAAYLHPRTMRIIAVGDRAKIEPQLKKLHLGDIAHRKPDGALVKR
jgi:zinc protease